MTWGDVWEAGRGLYSIALVVALACVARFAPAALRALNKFSDAIVDGASALRGATASADTLRKIDEIHAAVCRPDRSSPP